MFFTPEEAIPRISGSSKSFPIPKEPVVSLVVDPSESKTCQAYCPGTAKN